MSDAETAGIALSVITVLLLLIVIGLMMYIERHQLYKLNCFATHSNEENTPITINNRGYCDTSFQMSEAPSFSEDNATKA